METLGSWINGSYLTGGDRSSVAIHNPYDKSVIGRLDLARSEDLEMAIESAEQTFEKHLKKMPAHQKGEILFETAARLKEQTDEFAKQIVLESGKPLKAAKAEVKRGVQLLQFAGEASKQLSGETIPMDSAEGGENRLGMVRREPVGVVGAISPFNFPLNLVLHKLAPAFAAGNTAVLKPASQTPFTALKLGRLFQECGLPDGALQIVIGSGKEIGTPLVRDDRVRKVSFTGSRKVGKQLLQEAGLKKVTLELGSNSPNLVFADADLELALDKLVTGSFAYAGQVCISVQRIYVEKKIIEKFCEQFVKRAERLKVGNPMHESTDIGPLIDEDAAEKAEEWIADAVSQGAKLVTGGKRTGTMMKPAVLAEVSPDMLVVKEEAFAPLVCMIPFEDEAEAIQLANQSVYGLQAGVFTQDIDRALRVAHSLETGGVWINDSSLFRLDHYPYGGVKESGIGREGVRYAIEEMTHRKFIGIHFQG